MLPAARCSLISVNGYVNFMLCFFAMLRYVRMFLSWFHMVLMWYDSGLPPARSCRFSSLKIWVLMLSSQWMLISLNGIFSAMFSSLWSVARCARNVPDSISPR